MSKSRRGLLAAGLAAAVVGATGVVWTLNASAAEAPIAAETVAAETSAAADAEGAEVTPVAPAADGVEPVVVPPKLLPWGERPRKMKRGRAGASSAAVAAAGADAAPADTSGSLVPAPEYAPKGRSTKTLPSRQRAVPPTPPGSAKAAKDDDPVFHYAVGEQWAETDGSWANLSIATPELGDEDFHTLTEIAVRSADKKHAVEVGWNVDPTVNGDSDPHLFVFHWVKDKPACYNGCGFVQYSTTVKPGDTLPSGEAKRFAIQHSPGGWWIGYNSEWIGYFPDRLWDGNYTRAGYTQWFGEVAALDSTPCTDMGNGKPASNGSAARVGSIAMVNGPDANITVYTDPANSPYYSVDRRSDLTFRFGGAGTGTC